MPATPHPDPDDAVTAQRDRSAADAFLDRWERHVSLTLRDGPRDEARTAPRSDDGG